VSWNLKRVAAICVFYVIIVTCTLTDVSSASTTQTLGTWASQAQMSTPRYALAVVALNGKIYATGGISNTQIESSSANERYDPQTDRWTIMAQLPIPSSYCAAVACKGKIYVLGGVTQNGSQSVNLVTNQVFDPLTNSWTKMASIPGYAWPGCSATEVQGKIYLIGGGDERNLVEVYDPATDSWATKASCPEMLSWHAAAALDNKIYVLASVWPAANSNASISPKTLIYDVTSNAWSYGAPFHIIVQDAAVVVANASGAPAIYLIGGQPLQVNSPGGIRLASSYVQIYFPGRNCWVAGENTPTEHARHGAAVINDEIYVIGGYHSTTFATIIAPALLGIKVTNPSTGGAQGIWGPPRPTQSVVGVPEATNQAYTFQDNPMFIRLLQRHHMC